MAETTSRWLSLPDYIAEMILERLPLADYLRFPAVCTEWRSVQRNHRFRFRQSAPPMLPLPWLVPCKIEMPRSKKQTCHPTEEPAAATILPCLSPFEQKVYRLPLPAATRTKLEFVIGSRHGWLILLKQRNKKIKMDFDRLSHTYPARFSLLNPVSGQEIDLPPLDFNLCQSKLLTAELLVAAPAACFVFVAYEEEIAVHRLGESVWTLWEFEDGCISNVIAFGGKIWCHLQEELKGFLSVDPQRPETATLSNIHMDNSELPDFFSASFLVESDGELLAAVVPRDGRRQEHRFLVFRADLARKKWVRMDSLGDKALVLGMRGGFPSDNVKGNCIYFSEKCYDPPFGAQIRSTPWMAFDLESERTTDGLCPDSFSGDDLLQYRHDQCWMVASLSSPVLR